MRCALLRISKYGACLVFATGVIYVLLICSFSSNPSGKYASYNFIPHDPWDMITFANGLVRLETCCGDEDMGSYAADNRGDWIWTIPRRYRKTDEHPEERIKIERYKISREVFYLRIQSMQEPIIDIRLRGRIIKNAPL